MAVAKKGEGVMKLFDEWSDIARNIRAASDWVSGNSMPVLLRAEAESFVYDESKSKSKDENLVSHLPVTSHGATSEHEQWDNTIALGSAVGQQTETETSLEGMSQRDISSRRTV